MITQLEDGDYYVLGTLSPVKAHIRDNDPVDIEADGLPEEWEDEEYNETNPGLYLVLNDDDDDNNGTIDGWDHPVPPGDDELEDVILRFPDEVKSLGEQQATVTLSLSERRFCVWHNGQLLLGGPESPYVPYGPLSVVLDHASLGPEMTVQVEFVPPPPPEPGPPYSPYVAEVPFTPISGNLSLQASDVGPRGSGSTDVLALLGLKAAIDLDVDSDNTAATTRTQEEDELEDDPDTGKVVIVTDGDFDADGIIDTEDFGGIADFNFAPLYLSLLDKAGVAHNQITITFTYSSANIRLWKKDAAIERVQDDIIQNNVGYTAVALDMADDEGEFFIEGLSASDGTVPITATVTYANANGADEGLIREDQVHVAPTKLNLVLKKVNNNTAAGDLPEEIEFSEGAWVPFNNDDDDYSSTGPGDDGRDNAQSGAIPGENDLLPSLSRRSKALSRPVRSRS